MTDTEPEVIVSPPPSDIVVVVDSPPEIVVAVDAPPPPVVVEVHQVGLPGRDGKDGDAVSGELIKGAILEHANDPTPHPAYDDAPSLLLLYLNAKV